MKTLLPTKVDTVFWKSFELWKVPYEWQQELYNYLVLGFQPGGFHKALFANDLFAAAIKSHPLNTWDAITGTCKWMINVSPRQSWGSYENVESWLLLPEKDRTKILVDKKLLSTEEEVVWNIISSNPNKSTT